MRNSISLLSHSLSTLHIPFVFLLRDWIVWARRRASWRLWAARRPSQYTTRVAQRGASLGRTVARFRKYGYIGQLSLNFFARGHGLIFLIFNGSSLPPVQSFSAILVTKGSFTRIHNFRFSFGI